MIGLFQIPPGGVPYIPVSDPALSESADLTQYLRTFDPKYQKVVDGKTPTRFYLKRLTLKQWETVRSQPPALQDKVAMSLSVERVDSFIKANGDHLTVSFTGEGEERRLDHDTLAAMYSPGLFAEVSKIIILLSGLDPLAGAR